jgi:hypothetical protein
MPPPDHTGGTRQGNRLGQRPALDNCPDNVAISDLRHLHPEGAGRQAPASEQYSYDMGTAITSSGDLDFIDLGLLRPGLIVGGFLRITAKVTVGSSRASAARTLKIVGKNPSPDDLAEMLRALGSQGMCGNDAWALLRAFKQESDMNSSGQMALRKSAHQRVWASCSAIQ